MFGKWQKLILILCAALIIGGFSLFWIISSNMTICINEVPVKVSKDIIIDRDKEIYVDVLKMLNLQEIPVHVGDFGITVLLSGSKVVRLDVENNSVVVNGNPMDITEEDYTYKGEKLYLSEKMYRKLFDQAIIYSPEKEIKYEAYDVGKFKISQGLTFGEYFNMSPEERENLMAKNLYSKKIFELQVNLLPGDELNPIIKDAYNEVATSFDFYRQYQFYNWHLGFDDTTFLTGYLLCSNAQTILRQFENMKILREIADIKDFTAADIEYINRINTIYNAINFSKIKLLGPAIESYIDSLNPSVPGWDVYKNAAEKALEQFNQTFKVERIDRLAIPAWAEYDSYYYSLKNVPYLEPTYLTWMEEFLDYIPEDVKNTIELIDEYGDAEEIILAMYPEWKDYLPGPVMEEAIENFVANLNEGAVKTAAEGVKTVFKDFNIIEFYDFINLYKDVGNLLITERGNDYFAELKRSKAESVINITEHIIDPVDLITSGFELNNVSLVSTGWLLGLEFFIAEEFMSRIEEVGKMVNGMVLMSMDTDSIDDVYRGNITLEEYLDGE